MRLGVAATLVGGRLVPGDVEVVDGAVAGYGLASPGGRGIAAPGFVDLQVNGFAGIDFLDTDQRGYAAAGAALLETGVTAYVPTFITSSEGRLVAALRAVPGVPGPGPRILGVHLEGPFLSAVRLGTHPVEDRRDPDVGLASRLLAAGPVVLMTVAPELQGAPELIAFLRERNVVVSCGHTNATAIEAASAFDHGVRTVTHLFNAMRPLTQRDPGIVGAALARPDVIVQIIVDSVHLAPEIVQLIWRAASGRVALVTDAIAAAGIGDGAIMLGTVEVEVRDAVARQVGEAMLAGSVLTMIEAVRSLHALGVPLEQALDAGSLVPAKVLGSKTLGRIEVGAPADIVILDDGLQVERVLVGGETYVAA